MRFFSLAILWLFLSVTNQGVQAQQQAENQQNLSNVSVELITIGPGPYYWEAFGHSALRIKTGDQDYMFGFGYFDFEEEDFFLKFAKGEMRYFLGVEETNIELQNYRQQRRTIWSQTLSLSSEQKSTVISAMNQGLSPENRYYRYDYFLNNCTSRIRDVLDEVTDGDLSGLLKGDVVDTQKSWSDLTFPVANQAWMNVGIAMAYGLPAYTPRNSWQQGVFPVEFAERLDDLSEKISWVQPLQVEFQPDTEQLYQNHHDFFKTHYAIVVCVLLVALIVLLPFCRAFGSKLWLITQSLVGVLLLMLWLMTEHSVAAQNINVLLFCPLAFVLVKKKWRNAGTLMLFLLINVVWLVCALFVTDWYLIGFLAINLWLWWQLNTERMS